MTGVIRQYIAISLGIIAFIGGAIGFLLPEGISKGDRLGLWLFVLETFSWELCLAGIFSLAFVVLTHSPLVQRTLLQEISLLWNPQRNLLAGVPPRAIRRARLLAAMLLAGSTASVLLLLGSVTWWTWKYLDDDLFLAHYRKESLLTARAAQLAGENELALKGYVRFSEVFPDRVEPNHVHNDIRKINGRQKAAVEIEQRALAHRAKHGLNPEALAMLASAVDLDFADERLRATLAGWLAEAEAAISEAAAWANSCNTVVAKSESQTAAFVGTFLDAVSWNSLGDAAKVDTLRLACTELSKRQDNWGEVGELRWRLDELKELLENTSSESRHAIHDKYLRSAREVHAADMAGSRVPFIDQMRYRLRRFFSLQRDAKAEELVPEPIALDDGVRFPMAVKTRQDGEYFFQWPVSGVVVASFEETNSRGVEIRAAPGAPVRASQSGFVGYTGNSLLGYGNAVVVVAESEKIATVYARLGDIRVNAGDTVRHGDVIGFVPDPSGEDAESVRFEIRIDGVPSDPLASIAAARAQRK